MPFPNVESSKWNKLIHIQTPSPEPNMVQGKHPRTTKVRDRQAPNNDQNPNDRNSRINEVLVIDH
jgi:hypothetical protein